MVLLRSEVPAVKSLAADPERVVFALIGPSHISVG
ncbi:hypothetical protein MVAC_10417 [Mycolicibacterium vaccae ATCC 25954]|uniref:Uncharacterized protein n=1 Tax=Mycolicibacterium vaccae ATCC 25954 TaxID=1194972 RepID=K0V5Q4_MYCVA|nr:hypothetical protein MVAC_10417 [Mycolicibacterium vaccae ATCC 25954]